MRNIDARRQRRLQNGLAGLEGEPLAVEGEDIGDLGHISAPKAFSKKTRELESLRRQRSVRIADVSKWAAASSRPTSSRARARAASRSKPGSKSLVVRRRSNAGL